MKKLLSLVESVVVIAEITLVVKGTIDIYDKIKSKIIDAKAKKALEKKGYIFND